MKPGRYDLPIHSLHDVPGISSLLEQSKREERERARENVRRVLRRITFGDPDGDYAEGYNDACIDVLEEMGHEADK